MPLTVTQRQNAVRNNPLYARSVPWISQFRQVAHLLGFHNFSPGPEQFAEAVADWQRRHGLSADGMLGPNTWRQMEPETQFSVDASLFSRPSWLSTIIWPSQSEVDPTLLRLITRFARHPASAADVAMALGEDVDNLLEMVEHLRPGQCLRAFQLASGKKVLFEFESGKWVNRLPMYPRKSRKMYYEAGDILLASELDESQLCQMFPASFTRREATLTEVALAYAGVTSPKYTVGRQIDSINPRTGHVELHGALILKSTATNETTVLDLDGSATWSVSQLSESLHMHRVAEVLVGLIPILEILAEVAGAAVGGVGQGAVRGLRRMAMRQALRQMTAQTVRRAAALLLNQAVQRGIEASRAFAMAFYTTFESDRRRLEQLHRLDPSIMSRPSLEVAITNGSVAFVGTLVTSSVSAHMSREDVNKVAQEVTSFLLTAKFSFMQRLLTNAVRAATGGDSRQGGFSVSNFTSVFGSQSLDMLKDALKAAAEAGASRAM